MGDAVFILCAATSLVASVLLARTYLRSPSRVLLGTLLCFTGLAMTNVLLAIDALTPGYAIPWRGIPSLVGLGALAVIFMLEDER